MSGCHPNVYHCLKSVQIRSFFWSVFSCFQSEYTKMRTRNNSVFGHFSHSAHISDLSGHVLEKVSISCFITWHWLKQIRSEILLSSGFFEASAIWNAFNDFADPQNSWRSMCFKKSSHLNLSFALARIR